MNRDGPKPHTRKSDLLSMTPVLGLSWRNFNRRCEGSPESQALSSSDKELSVCNESGAVLSEGYNLSRTFDSMKAPLNAARALDRRVDWPAAVGEPLSCSRFSSSMSSGYSQLISKSLSKRGCPSIAAEKLAYISQYSKGIARIYLTNQGYEASRTVVFVFLVSWARVHFFSGSGANLIDEKALLRRTCIFVALKSPYSLCSV